VSTFRSQVRVRPVDLPEEARQEGATYHRATRTLNLLPEPAEMGPGMPRWVRSRLDALV
jgi:hypothetical protein